MGSKKKAAEKGQDLILDYLKKRMKSEKVRQYNLAKTLGLSEPTLIRYFKKETSMPLGVFLEICGVLNIRPYLIPKESDTTEMHQMFFN